MAACCVEKQGVAESKVQEEPPAPSPVDDANSVVYMDSDQMEIRFQLVEGSLQLLIQGRQMVHPSYGISAIR